MPQRLKSGLSAQSKDPKPMEGNGGTSNNSNRSDAVSDLLSEYEKGGENPSWWNERIGSDLGLSISDCSKLESSTECSKPTDASSNIRKDLACRGFALVDGFGAKDVLISKLRHGILRLTEHKLPATFIFLFDEAWELARCSKRLLRTACHPSNKFNFDVLAWHISPGGAGFSPHRDRQPEDAKSSFHNDPLSEHSDEPKFVTHWVGLSNATPTNSCLYVIPKDCDPGYLEGDSDEDPLKVALPNKDSYQRIKAVPRDAGQSLLFSHRLIHWGSRSDADHDNPRVAISFVCSDPEFEAPFLKFDFSEIDSCFPPFHVRLLLVCAQLLCYHERFQPCKATIRACYNYCKKFENHLGEDFRKKVFIEFVSAMKGQEKDTPSQSASTTEAHCTEDTESKDSDEEDAMMEEMLNAEDGGYGVFEDDFDEFTGRERAEDPGDEDDSDDGEEVNIFGKREIEVNRVDLSKKPKKVEDNS